MLRMIEYFNLTIAVLLTAAYAYQLVYLLIGFVRRNKPDHTIASTQHRFAVVISARNEANVIGGLIESLKAQRYPSELLDIYVVADNCTDDTAAVSRAAGAYVYERFNKVQVGKGYAMDYLFRRLRTEGRDDYDGYFVFDADN